jgi:hypothetical protein
LLLVASCGALIAGCGSSGGRLDLTTYDEQGAPRQHYADFRRAFYRQSPGGTLDLVFRAERPSSVDPTQTITQLVHVKSFWNPRPGTTFVEATQINARVQYAMLTPPTGVRYDGTAFISYKLDKHTGLLTGRFESGSLSPRFRMGDAIEPFGQARFTGSFSATESPRDVVQAIQKLEGLFSQRIQTRQLNARPSARRPDGRLGHRMKSRVVVRPISDRVL